MAGPELRNHMVTRASLVRLPQVRFQRYWAATGSISHPRSLLRRELQAPTTPPRPLTWAVFSHTRTLAPFSTAEQAAEHPALPAPRISTSVSMVSTIWSSAIASGLVAQEGAA